MSYVDPETPSYTLPYAAKATKTHKTLCPNHVLLPRQSPGPSPCSMPVLAATNSQHTLTVTFILTAIDFPILQADQLTQPLLRLRLRLRLSPAFLNIGISLLTRARRIPLLPPLL